MVAKMLRQYIREHIHEQLVHQYSQYKSYQEIDIWYDLMQQPQLGDSLVAMRRALSYASYFGECRDPIERKRNFSLPFYFLRCTYCMAASVVLGAAKQIKYGGQNEI